MKTVDFSETIAACDLKVGRCRRLIEIMKVCDNVSIEGQGHFLPYIYQVLYVLCFTGPRYQVSVYRTIGPLVQSCWDGATASWVLPVLLGGKYALLKDTTRRPEWGSNPRPQVLESEVLNTRPPRPLF